MSVWNPCVSQHPGWEPLFYLVLVCTFVLLFEDFAKKQKSLKKELCTREKGKGG
jgi:hypothetical protein